MNPVNVKACWLFAAVVMVLGAMPVHADRYQRDVSAQQERELERARSLRQRDRNDEAIRILQALLREQPDYYLASYNLALAYADVRAYPRALEQFEHAEKLQRKYGIKDPTLFNSYGWACLLAGDYDAAERSFKKAEAQFDLLSDASKSRLLNNMGVLYQYKKDYKTAEMYFRRAADDFSSSLARENYHSNRAVQIQQQPLRSPSAERRETGPAR